MANGSAHFCGQAGVTHAVAFSIEACYGGIDIGNAYTLGEVESATRC